MSFEDEISDIAAKRAHKIGILVFMLFSLLFARLWFLQVNASKNFIKNAKLKRERTVITEAPRGRILDRNGNVLVDNKYVPSISLEKKIGAEKAKEVCNKLAPILGITQKVLYKRWSSPKNDPHKPVIIAKGVSFEGLTYISERKSEYEGVDVVQVPVRVYKYGDVAAHILGYIGLVSDSDIKNGNSKYRLGDYIGKTGAEHMFEKYLRGEPSVEKFQVDNQERIDKTQKISKKPAIPGADVYLSIDIIAQVAAEKQISRGTVRTLERPISESLLSDQSVSKTDNSTTKEKIFTSSSKPGAAVAIDPNTGQVIVLASYPTYNPTAFLRGDVTQSEYEQLISDKNGKPFLNRAIQGVYPPGSTYKLITAYAALNSGLITKDTVIVDGGKIIIGGQKFTNAGDGKVAWGPVALEKAISVSSDIYFYTLGRDFWKIWNHNKSDPKGLALQETASSFGFGKQTGIGDNTEQKGVVPSPSQKIELAKAIGSNDTQWLPGNNVLFAIGQGDTGATPIQIANAYATFANGGNHYKTTMLYKVVSHSGKTIYSSKPKLINTVPLEKTNWDAMLAGFKGAITGGNGTAFKAFQDSPIRNKVYGKTGTAQVSGKQDHAWFAGVYEDGKTQLAGVVIMEHAGFGGEVSAPMLRNIFEAYDKELQDQLLLNEEKKKAA